jgi:hypothetical protein
MAMKITKVDVWAAELADQPGGLARVLDALSRGGANVECVIARRNADRPGTGVAFISPVKGKKAQDAARNAGAAPATNVATLRVEGSDMKGMGARLTSAVADAGINMRGLSAAVIGNRYVAYFGFDSAADADRAAKAMKGAAKAKGKTR